jgi:hypothetical protein
MEGTHGTFINVLNYDYYQNIKNYEGYNDGHSKGHNIKKKRYKERE